MKKQSIILLAITLFAINSSYAQAPQSWKYNFGTNAGNVLSGKGITRLFPDLASPVNGIGTPEVATTVVLPNPATGQRIRLRTGTGIIPSGYALVTSGTTFGSGARLKMTAASTTSSNKFSILGIDGTTKFVAAFNIKLDGGSVSYHRVAVGKDPNTLDADGLGTTQFSNNLNFGGATLPTFLIMQWRLSNTDIYTLEFQKKDKTTFTLDPASNPGISFVKGGEYRTEIYANNSATSADYTKDLTNDNVDNPTTFTITSGSYHIWINGVQLMFASGNANFTTAELAVGQVLNAFMFLSVDPSGGTTNDGAVAYVDDLLYANYLADAVTLPIKLTDFTAKAQGSNVKLNWSTASETNNATFEVLRSKNATDFTPITSVKGSGTTQTQQNYSFVDYNPIAGVNYYKLKQLDFDGNSSESKVVAVKVTGEKPQLKVIALPDQQAIELTAYAEENGTAIVKIVDLSGKKLSEQSFPVGNGFNTLKVPTNVQKGVYAVSVKIADQVSTAKFIF